MEQDRNSEMESGKYGLISTSEEASLMENTGTSELKRLDRKEPGREMYKECSCSVFSDQATAVKLSWMFW